jgi:hypothetical protein
MESEQDTLDTLDELAKVRPSTLRVGEDSSASVEHAPQEGEIYNKLGDLNPYAQLLTPQDVASCVALENAAFVEPDQRCSKEKVDPARNPQHYQSTLNSSFPLSVVEDSVQPMYQDCQNLWSPPNVLICMILQPD